MEDAINEWDYEKIIKIIDGMEDEYRLLIKLRDIDGLSYEEIAKITDKPLGTVKSRLHYARKELRSRLKEVLGYE